ncbi:MAG: porin [Thermoanaerobaculia bacterium]
MTRAFQLVFTLLFLLAPVSLFAQESSEQDDPLVEALRKLKISGYIQGQYVASDASVDEFSVRRARLKVVYRANAFAAATIQLDAARDVTVKDAFIELTEPWTGWNNTLTLGQFKWPFGFELLYSSSSREMPERSRVVRALFPGERDRGAMMSGEGFGERLDYRLAVVNGSGTEEDHDPNSDKDLVGRLGWDFGSLALGGSFYSGEDLVATPANPAGEPFDKTRLGADLQWATPLPGSTVRAEYIEGEERGADVRGWYAYVIQKLGERNEIAVRVDEYDPDDALAGDAILTVGGSWTLHFDRHTKLMLAWERPEREEADPNDDVFTARVQFKF